MKTGRKENTFYRISSIEYLKVYAMGIAGILAISYLFYASFLGAIALIPLFVLWSRMKFLEMYREKKRVLAMQFKDGMLAVSFALNVGYSMENAFAEAIGELKMLYGKDSLIVREFTKIVHRTGRNEQLEDVLEEFALYSEIDDIRYFAAVFRYAKRSGGDLLAIIKNTVRTIGEKIDTENEIQLVISGKKMEQKVMSYVPFAIICYLKLTAPEFITPLYGSALGIGIMTGSLLVYAVSVWLGKRIVNIEV